MSAIDFLFGVFVGAVGMYFLRKPAKCICSDCRRERWRAGKEEQKEPPVNMFDQTKPWRPGSRS